MSALRHVRSTTIFAAHVLFAFVATVAAQTWSAAAQEVEFRPPPVGLVVEYDDGGVFHIESVSDDRVSYRVESKNGTYWFTTASIFHQYRHALSKNRKLSSLATSIPSLEAIWPLKVGKEVSFKDKWFDFTDCPGWEKYCGKFAYDLAITLRVEARETVSVPAGTFSAYVVRRTRRIIDPKTGKVRPGTTRFWYVPELRWFVRYTFTRIRGGEEKSWDVNAVRIVQP